MQYTLRYKIFFQVQNIHLKKNQLLLYPHLQSYIIFLPHGMQVYTMNLMIQLPWFSQHMRVDAVLAYKYIFMS